MTSPFANRAPIVAVLLSSALGSCSGGGADTVDGNPGMSVPDGGGPVDEASPGEVAGSGASALPNPCGLLTAEEWETMMEGIPIVEPRSGSAGGVNVTRCDWTYNENGAATGSRRQWGNISVAVAGAYGPTPGSQTADIGDEGYLLPTDIARTIDIGWKKGAASATFKYSALVLPPGKAWPELRDAAIALATQAAARMP